MVKAKDLILKTLAEKLPVKQKAAANAEQAYNLFVAELEAIGKEMEAIAGNDVQFKSIGKFECELRFGEDVLIFYLHADVYDMDPDHALWKTSYLKDGNNAYCGMISIFNFLQNSFQYNRQEDVGYMIGRVFINHENHFYAEGKRQLGFLYNDFVNAELDKNAARSIVESAILFSLDFDLLTPPFNTVHQVKVGELLAQNQIMGQQTGKRLGFRFQADNDQVE